MRKFRGKLEAGLSRHIFALHLFASLLPLVFLWTKNTFLRKMALATPVPTVTLLFFVFLSICRNLLGIMSHPYRNVSRFFAAIAILCALAGSVRAAEPLP